MSRWKPLLIIGLSIFVFSCTNTKTDLPSRDIAIDKPNSKASVLSDTEKNVYTSAIEFLEVNDYKQAEKVLSKLAKRHSGHVGVLTNLAIVNYQLNKFDKAKSYIDMAYANDSNNKNVLNILGLLSVENNKFTDAEKYYLKALKNDNEFALAHYNLAVLCDIYYQDINRAYTHYSKYLELVGANDQETKDWVEQLKYSIEQ